ATYDLTTGGPRDPDPLDYLTKITACSASPVGTQHPRWSAFLARITAGNAELQGFLQRYIGYCCTGLTTELSFVFAYGTGANGKSTFRIFGDYATVAHGHVHCQQHGATSDRPGQAAGRPPGGRTGNPAGSPLGRDQAQSPDRRRQAYRPVHATGFLRLY